MVSKLPKLYNYPPPKPMQILKKLILLSSALLVVSSPELSLAQNNTTANYYSISGLGSSGPTSPLIGDHDRDPSNGLEIAVTTSDGTIQMLNSSGSVIWANQTPNSTCAAAPSNDKLYTAPVVGELYGDGQLYVVVGYGGFRGKSCDGGVAAYRASNGELAWIFSIKKFAKKERFFAFRHAVYGTPSLADVDNDGKLEIGFGSFDRNVYLLNPNGSVRWYYTAADTVFSSPQFIDLFGNGKLAMIIGTDISKNTRIKPPTHNGGYIYALNAAINTGTQSPKRYNFRSHELQIWRTPFNQVIQSDPVVADILPDNPGLEVVTGSGCFFPQKAKRARNGKWYKILSASSGRVLKTLAVSSCTPNGARVGDLNGDGLLEVIFTTSGSSIAGGDGVSRVSAWTPSLDTVLWSVQPKVNGTSDSLGGHYKRVPVLADLNGDGLPEVVVNHHTGVVIINGVTGEQLSCEGGSCTTKPSLKLNSVLQGSPGVGDINRDGVKDIVAIGRREGNAVIGVWSGGW